jgi:ATP-binding cassette subfamily C protein LapB
VSNVKSSSDVILPENEGTADALAQLLVKISALAGVAVPHHRFAYPEVNSDGMELSKLEPINQAIELWKIRFADGQAREIDPIDLKKSDLPVLWFGELDGYIDIRIVRGIQNQGFLVETKAGNTEFLDKERFCAGKAVRFAPGPADALNSEEVDYTAKQWFFKAIKKRRSVFFEAVLGTFMVSIFGLVSALYTMQVYDRVVPTNGFSTLWVLTIGVLLAIAFEFLMKIVRAQMVDRASNAIDIELSSIFFGKALDIRAESRPHTVGTFASQIRHFESVRNFMTSSTLFILADAPFALFFIFIIYMIAGPVAIVPLCVLPLGFIIGFSMKGPIERYAAETMEESNKKNGLLIEAIDGIEAVKAVSAEWKIKDRWRDLTLQISNSELKTKLLTAISTSSAQSVQQLSYVGIIATGAYAISQGNLTMGGLIACSIISGRALTPLAQIPNLIVQWKHAKIALDVLDGIMAMPSEQTTERNIVPDHCDGQIKVSELSFAYVENTPPVQVGNMEINPGDRIAVLGAVGSGKSTLLKLLSGLYRPQAGKVFLDGVDTQLIAVEFLREQMGYLPQEVRLFNGSLRENLVLGLPVLSDSQILKAAAKTGLDRAIKGHPLGLDILISEGGKGLSGGQRQLVGLTRMLLARPKVLLLDEPTASMDSQLEAQVLDHLFHDVDKEAVVIMATHKAGAMKHANRVMVMEAGRVVLDGPKEKVLEEINRQAAKRRTN